MERVMGYFLQVKSQPMINLQWKHMCMKTVKMQSSNYTHDAKCPILKTKETDIGIIKLQMCKKVRLVLTASYTAGCFTIINVS